MEGPMREVAFNQTHRRTNRRRHIVVSQFNDPEAVTPIRKGEAPRLFSAGLAWRYIVQAGANGPPPAFRRVAIAADASDEEVVQTVTRHLAALGWSRDPVVAPDA
jgi:hypothetical protein